MARDSQCPFCRGAIEPALRVNDGFEVQCSACGPYWISGSAYASLSGGNYPDDRWRFAAASRRASDAGLVPKFTVEDLNRVVRDMRTPGSPLEVADELLLDIASASPTYRRNAVVPSTDWPRYRLREADELRAVFDMLVEMKLINMPATDGSVFLPTLTVEGWSKVVELRRDTGEGRLGFVAMSFHPALTMAYDEGIFPAIEADCGFSAIRVDRAEYNDRIDDRIIAELRRSRFVVADFTLQRPGVYFEAGFGLGLGRPVIYMCRADDIDNVHFDTRQYNHIKWETPQDLREKLTNRIRATIGTAVRAAR